jgi:hypothetical protein
MIEDIRPVRSLPPAGLFLLAFALIFLSVVAGGAVRLGADGWEVLSVEQKVVTFAALAASATLMAVSMVRQMAPGSKEAISATVLPIGGFVVLMAAMGAVFRSEQELAFVANGLKCLRIGLQYSIPPIFLFWLLLRRGAVLFPGIAGAAAGGFAGLIGLSVLQISCPNLNTYHILVWHLGVILISALAGAGLGAAVGYFDRRSQETDPA